MADKIDAAVAAAGTPTNRVGVRVRLSTGREVGLNVPSDFTGLEALELTGFVATGLAAEIVKARRPAQRIIVPHLVARG